MNDKDKEAFENWFDKINKDLVDNNCAMYDDTDKWCMGNGWQAACELKNKQINNLESEKQKLFVKLSKELEIEKARVSQLQEENDKLKDCVNFYAAGNVQFDHEYIAVQSGLVSKIGSYARKVLNKLENK
jgi:hypothetical protein